MNEELLQFIWKFRLLSQALSTADGTPIKVIHPGQHNTDSGPDFFNARIMFGKTLWAGNVEIHINASDWYRHGHQEDRAYDSIILHVILNPDAEIRRHSGELIPTLIISEQFSPEILFRYQEMMNVPRWTPCSNMLSEGTSDIFRLWAPALMVNRLADRSERLHELWRACNYDWEEAFYRQVAKGFGFKINATPFEMVAMSVPLKVIHRHCRNPFQVEALMFGQAGMLEGNISEEFPRRLKMEYEFLRAKYNLEPVNQSLWKFLRLRPSNFPTIRLSQFCDLLVKQNCLLSKVADAKGLSELKSVFDVSAGNYWNTHFTFDRVSPFKVKCMGESSVNLLITNTIAPFLFFFGSKNDRPSMRESALRLLEEIPSESNAEVRTWSDAGIRVSSTLHTQALLQLKSTYCDRKRCLECRIGKFLLSNPSHHEIQEPGR